MTEQTLPALVGRLEATVRPLLERLRDGPYVQDGTKTRATMSEAADEIEALTARLRAACNTGAHAMAHAHRRIATLETELQRECDDGTELLRMLGLDPETYCTEGGSLNLPKIRAALAERPNAEVTVMDNEDPTDPKPGLF